MVVKIIHFLDKMILEMFPITSPPVVFIIVIITTIFYESKLTFSFQQVFIGCVHLKFIYFPQRTAYAPH
jgi:hypothetical protein